MKSLNERINALTPEQRALFEKRLNEKKIKPKWQSTLKGKRIQSRNHNNPSPLSFDQVRLWFFNRMHPEVWAYNVYGVANFKGKLNHSALEHSINAIVQRHEAWRTVFDAREPLQYVLPELRIEVPTVDVTYLKELDQGEEIQRLVQEEVQRLFDLEKGPLIRFKLFYKSNTEAKLVMTVHHIVMDHLSFPIFFEEMVANYKAFSDNKPAQLLDLPVQYSDYTEWQHDYLKGEIKENLLSFWKDQLKDSDYVLDLTTDFPRTPAVTYRGARSFITFSKEDLDRLKDIAKGENATAFMIFLTAFKVLLHRYTGQSDILVGSPLANRNRLELEKVIGYFLTIGTFRSDISGDMSFRELLNKVRETAIGVYKNQDLPIGLLLDEIKVPIDPSRNPLFQAVFVYIDEHEDKLNLPELDIEFQLIDGMNAKYDLTVGFTESKKGLQGFFEYSPDLFREETISNMKHHFCSLLKEIILNPDMKISEMKMLSEQEQNQLLVEWNQSHQERSFDQFLHSLVEHQAAKTPDTVAVKYGGNTLTYKELNEKSNQFAQLLIKSGITKQSKIGLVMDTSLEMVVSMLGIFKAGCVYVPVETSFPIEWIQYVLNDAGVETLVTQPNSETGNAVNVKRKIYLDSNWSSIKDESSNSIQSDISKNDLAYIMYTSGSTGKPKGVAVEHDGVCNVIEHSVTLLGLSKDSKMLQLSSINFDASIVEIFSSLSSGATLCIAPKKAKAGGMDLIRFISEERITTMMVTPTVISTITPEQLPESVNTMALAGEPVTLEIKDWKTENRRVINIYGPTETSIYVLTNDFDYNDKPSSVGRPIQNTQAYILDGNQQLVPIGVRGELYIGGIGVARGYLNNDKLTKESFLENPFRPGEIMYRTGDYSKWLPDGTVEILGRKDDQVKINGARIETGQIEAVIKQYPSIEEVVVIVKSNSMNSNFLCAYYQSEKEVDEETLRSFLINNLPTYMIPAHFVWIEKFPIGNTGKLNKKALPEPTIESEYSRTFVMPISEGEKIMASVWEEVLEINNIGLEDHFFNLGGDSLKAIQVSSALYKRGWEFEMKQVFLNPILKDLCLFLHPISNEAFLKWFYDYRSRGST